MKTALTILGAAGLFFGGVVLGLSHREPAATPPDPVTAAVPAAPSPSPAPAGDAPTPVPDELAQLRKENEALKAERASLQKAAETNMAKLMEEAKASMPAGMTGTKLMDDKLKQKLGLSADQESKMTQAIMKYMMESEEARKKADLDDAQKQAELARLKEGLESEFQGILSGSQYADLAAARSEKKGKARESTVQGESSMWQGMLGLDAEQGKELAGVLKDYYATRPGDAVQGQWTNDAATRSRIESILRTPEQQERFRHMGQGAGVPGGVMKMFNDMRFETPNKENK